MPLNLKKTFRPTIWIFTESEGDGIDRIQAIFLNHFYFKEDSNSAMKASLCIAGGIPEGICIEYLEFIALSPTQFA